MPSEVFALLWHHHRLLPSFRLSSDVGCRPRTSRCLSLRFAHLVRPRFFGVSQGWQQISPFPLLPSHCRCRPSFPVSAPYVLTASASTSPLPWRKSTSQIWCVLPVAALTLLMTPSYSATSLPLTSRYYGCYDLGGLGFEQVSTHLPPLLLVLSSERASTQMHMPCFIRSWRRVCSCETPSSCGVPR